MIDIDYKNNSFREIDNAQSSALFVTIGRLEATIESLSSGEGEIVLAKRILASIEKELAPVLIKD